MVLNGPRGGEMATDTTEPIERWTAKRRVVLVVSILKGETSVAEAARQPGLTVAELEELAREISAGRRKCAPQPTQGRRGCEGCADQETETEDRGSGPGQRYFTGGVEALPFGPEDIRRVSASRPGVSERRSCRVLRVSRAGLHRRGAGPTRRRVTDPPWTEQRQQLIQQHPPSAIADWGYCYAAVMGFSSIGKLSTGC